MGGSRGKPLSLALPSGARTSGSSSSSAPSNVTSLQASVIGTYVYCVVRAAAEPNVAVKAARLPEASVPRAVLLASRTWLVLADVPMGIYGSAALEQRLKDLD